MTSFLRTSLLSATIVIAFAIPAAAVADSNDFSVRTLGEPATAGLPVTGPLSDFLATSRGRVIVPTRWRALAGGDGRLRFQTMQNPSCTFRLTYTVRSLLGPSQPAADRVAAGLPAASARHLLDSGVHGAAAFRVVRRPSVGGRVRVDGLWTAVLTRRADIAPSGQVAWTEIRVAAASLPGDECHAGTWRAALGPTIGDSLAVARTRLYFTRKR